MKYHDNEVKFVLDNAYTLHNGSYTITSYFVTPGQDPDGEIYDGLVATCGQDGTFTFRVGQNASEETAKWFNDRITASETTFNHTAGKLSFAFIGTLKLNVSGGLIGAAAQEFTFNDVALAQGEEGPKNNWWFGGTNCTYTNGNKVDGIGFDSNNKTVVVTFQRGDGNDDSQVDVFM